MVRKRNQEADQLDEMVNCVPTRPTRVGTRNRTLKQFPDYVDCSFSESEPVRLIPIPPRRNANTSNALRGGYSGRGGGTTRGSNSARCPRDTSSTQGASVAKRGRYRIPAQSTDRLLGNIENEDISTCIREKQLGKNYFPVDIQMSLF